MACARGVVGLALICTLAACAQTTIADRLAASIADRLDQAGRIDDPVLSAYLSRLANRVAGAMNARASEIRLTRERFEYVSALPDGVIYMSAGLLSRIDDEAALAFVIAHEAAHPPGSRSGPAIPVIYPICLLSSPAGVLSPFASREREMEAMAAAVEGVERAGFDAQAGLDFISKLVARNPPWRSALAGDGLVSLRRPGSSGLVVDSSEFQARRAAVAAAIEPALQSHPPSLYR